MVVATLICVFITFQMWTIALKPDDFLNIQDSKTKWKNLNIKTKIESIEQIYDIPVNVVNRLLYADVPISPQHPHNMSK